MTSPAPTWQDGEWWDRDRVARFIASDAYRLPRLVKAGKLPAPSFHLGPRSPRWWSLDIDARFRGKLPDAPKGAEGLAEAIKNRARRPQAA